MQCVAHFEIFSKKKNYLMILCVIIFEKLILIICGEKKSKNNSLEL